MVPSFFSTKVINFIQTKHKVDMCPHNIHTSSSLFLNIFNPNLPESQGYVDLLPICANKIYICDLIWQAQRQVFWPVDSDFVNNTFSLLCSIYKFNNLTYILGKIFSCSGLIINLNNKKEYLSELNIYLGRWLLYYLNNIYIFFYTA